MPGSTKGGSPDRFRVFETRQFLADLARLGPAAGKRLEAKLREYVYPTLCQNPFLGPNIKQLRNWEPPTWRYRVGRWRFFYEINETSKIVFMTAADHRKQAYR